MCRSPSLSNLVALASAALLAAACSGEHALTPRDPTALSNGGGSGKGMAGAGGTTGVAGTAGQVAPPGGMGGTGTAGVGGAPSGAGGSVSGLGGSGLGGMGAVGGRPTGPTPTGSTCNLNSDCMTGYCFDKVCCATDCTGVCRTCNGKTPGQCALADDGTDPRNSCDVQTPQSCGTVGTCTATGTCKKYDKTTVCDPTPSCDATSSGVIQNKVCDGVGNCAAGANVSCNGFLCSAATCGTICGDDSACVAHGFCSASKCVAVSNVVPNGDFETGGFNGWAPANGTGSLAIASAAVAGDVHTGQYALVETGRSAKYHGPGYSLPTGIGKYTISLWAMQKQDPFLNGVLQIRVDCPDNSSTFGSYVTVQEGSGFGVAMQQGVWTQFSATVDLADARWALTPLCFASGGGLVKGATLYLNQPQDDGDPVVWPDLYIDDVVVTVPDGHNLIGNPNFESGLSSGWTATSGTPKVVTTFAHMGTRSLSLPARTTAGAGIKYLLPTGPGRYTVSFWAMQTGTMDHQLQLQPSYTCVGGTATSATPSTPVTAAANSWVQVIQTFVMPPLDAPAGCVLQQASVALQQADAGGTCAGGECPDLYIDDTSIVVPLQ
jgi:hypothetical protein